MKNMVLPILVALGISVSPLLASASDELPTTVPTGEPPSETSQKNGPAQSDGASQTGTTEKPSLVMQAAERRTPPWTNDSANINNTQPRNPQKSPETEPYSASDLTVKPEWKKLFSHDDRFSTTSGKELYRSMCQACHMPDGQGAQGAGVYPSFVGNERLRSPGYPIDVILHGLRGMPSFGDKLSNQQIADVVNYLRTNFGNQLASDATIKDVARVRH